MAQRPVAVLLARGAICLFAVLLLAGGSLLFASDAHAHGGQFTPPPEDDPPPDPEPDPKPEPRPPSDEPPPPPPTPPVPPTTPPPGSAPPPPSGGTGAVTPRGRRPTATNPETTWQTWWALNRLAFLPDREEALGRQVLTPSEGDVDPLSLSDWGRRRTLAARAHVIPFLLGLVDPKERQRNDVVASALIALGKIAQERETIAVLEHHLSDRRAAPIVRESAALALGLLRRTEVHLQYAGKDLDRVRDHLFATFDDEGAPHRTRAFCALAVGLLGDQGFANAYTRDGRMAIRSLWTRLEASHARRDLPVALLTALGMQPSRGLPDGVRDGLRSIVVGRSVHRRRWDSIERGHAFAALLRLGGPGSHELLLRVLGRKREHKDVRRAAFVALGRAAARMDASERLAVARALEVSLSHARDPLSRGLGHIAAGRLLGTDLTAGGTDVLRKTSLAQELLSEARSGPVPTRGFSALALALAAREVEADDRVVRAFLDEAERILVEALERGRGDDRLRGAYAVAVGLLGSTAPTEILREIVEDRGSDPEFRGHAAVALGQIGRSTPEIRRTLHLALAERRDADLRRQAALGLALLGGRLAATQLLRELRTGRTERLLAQVVIAIGRMGDLSAVPALTRHAAEEDRSEFAQALGVVALGLLTDPERRPSLLRLTSDAFYPGRTDALHEAYTIL
jgi:hypothetical protein